MEQFNFSEINVFHQSKLCTHLDRAKYSFQDENYSARGRAGGAATPSLNLGLPSYL